MPSVSCLTPTTGVLPAPPLLSVAVLPLLNWMIQASSVSLTELIVMPPFSVGLLLQGGEAALYVGQFALDPAVVELDAGSCCRRDCQGKENPGNNGFGFHIVCAFIIILNCYLP